MSTRSDHIKYNRASFSVNHPSVVGIQYHWPGFFYYAKKPCSVTFHMLSLCGGEDSIQIALIDVGLAISVGFDGYHNAVSSKPYGVVVTCSNHGTRR